jgi:hypothetical protein
VLGRSRSDALGAFARLGWRPSTPASGTDVERRRLLNLDLSEPELTFLGPEGGRAVARVETDRDDLVTLLEVLSTEAAEPAEVAAVLLPAVPGGPKTGGGEGAREWIWGPESGSSTLIADEPVRLWFCAEKAYGDRLWLVASLVRRASADLE